MSNIKPLGKRVLIKRAKAQTTKGGILLPDAAQEKPREGTVVAAGPGDIDEQGNLRTLDVKVGDRILFGAYAGTEVKNLTATEDEEYMILSQDDILGILT